MKRSAWNTTIVRKLLAATIVLKSRLWRKVIQIKTSAQTVSGKVVRHADMVFMGRKVYGTLYTKDGWRELFHSAGFEVQFEKSFNFRATLPYYEEIQDHYFVMGRKVIDHALMGPYPLPEAYPSPHPLSEAAWAPFAERLVRDENEAVLDLVKGNKKVLDVGSGYGLIPITLAQCGIQAYSIEPNADRQTLQKTNANSQVHITPGTAEQIPHPGRTFDALIAMWILHYVDNLEQSLREMARVIDPSKPNAQIVIVQGAPDNELVNMLNNVCVPLSARNTKIDHQGFLLHEAARVFGECGFGDVRVFRVDAYCGFPEVDLWERCKKAAEVLGDFWFKRNENLGRMREALIPQLELHFRDRPDAIGDEVAILVAKRLPN